MFRAKAKFLFAVILVVSACQFVSATQFAVETTADGVDVSPGDGVCATGTGLCSLRAAVQESNALFGEDSIVMLQSANLSSSGRFEDAAATGDLDLLDDVTILGIGNVGKSVDGGNLDRVFDVHQGVKAVFYNLSIQNGLGDGAGGGVRNFGNSTFNFCAVVSNTADGVLVSSTEPGHGGAIANLGGLVMIQRTLINTNIATGASLGFGAGLSSFGGKIVIQNSTISSNHASTSGGGLLGSKAKFEINNSTISGNVAGMSGGGIALFSGSSAVVNNITLAENNADLGFTPQGGGGFYTSSSILVARNSIFGNNTDSANVAPDCLGDLLSRGHNLIENTLGCNITGTTTGNILGQDPNILPLTFQGGPTPTYPFLSFLDSPAIDAGDNASCTPTDQRGIPRPQGSGSICDIGAVEVTTAESISTQFFVNSSQDQPDANIGDGVCAATSGFCTLRAAIQEANVSFSNANFIRIPIGTFQLSISGTGEQEAATGDLDLTDPDTFIIGHGYERTAIDGANLDRIFHNFSTTTIAGVAVRNGSNVGTGGGGIYNQGTLALSHSLVAGNATTSSTVVGGGGITNQQGTLTLIGTTVVGNTLIIPASNYGGGGIENFSFGTVNLIDSSVWANLSNQHAAGIWNNSGTLNITNSTISGNFASAGGAGLAVRGTVNLNNATITQNQTTAGGGGGIENFDGIITVQNSIIAANTDQDGGAPDCFGSLTSLGQNMFSDISGCSISGPAIDDIVTLKPDLDSLRDNGGLSFTHSISPRSPAHQSADNLTCEQSDQRGLSRPQADFCDRVHMNSMPIYSMTILKMETLAIGLR